MKKTIFLFFLSILIATPLFAQRVGAKRSTSSNYKRSISYSTSVHHISQQNQSASYSRSKEAVPLQRVTHYTNCDGQRVQSPTRYSDVPAGATAVCRDGSFSFSKNRRGTCSGHGGVARWLQ